MQEITSTRSNPLIDPDLHIWHGEVAAYLFLGGVVAGVMVLMGLWLLLGRRDGATAHAGPRAWRLCSARTTSPPPWWVTRAIAFGDTPPRPPKR